MTDRLDEALADASVLLACVCADAGDLQPVADRVYADFTSGDTLLLLLDLTVYEVVNVMVRRHRFPPAEAATAIADLFELSELVIHVDEALAVRASHLAAATGLSGYDASYLAAGERTGAPVLTLDRRLADLGAVHLADLRLR